MTNCFEIGETAPCRDQLDPSSVLAQVLEPFTRSFFAEAGLKPGMHVLNLWSGSGDVAFLAREVVGSTGRIIGFDNAQGLVGYANELAAYRGLTNVEFIEGTFESLSHLDQFDAVVGRLVLMYRQNPEVDLGKVLCILRPGGLILLQELDLLAATTVPPAREIEKTREWIRDICNTAGIEPQMGPKLHSTLIAAGLVNPKMRVDGLIGASDSILPKLLSQVAETLAPLHPIEMPSDREVRAGTLEESMRADLAQSGGVMSTALLISASARLPG